MRGCRIPCPSTVRGPGEPASAGSGDPLSPSAVLSSGAAATRVEPCGRRRGEGTEQQVHAEPPEAAPAPFTRVCSPPPSPASRPLPSGGRSRQGRSGGARTPCSCGRSASGGSSSKVQCGGPPGRTGAPSGAPVSFPVGLAELGTADPTSPSFSSFLKLGARAAGGGPAASSTQAAFKYVSWTPCPSVPTLRAHPCPNHPSDSPSVSPQWHVQVQCRPAGSIRGAGSSHPHPCLHLPGAPASIWTRWERSFGWRMGACVGGGGEVEAWQPDTEEVFLCLVPVPWPWPPATAPAPRPLSSIQRPNSFLFRSSSQSSSGGSCPLPSTNPVLIQH